MIQVVDYSKYSGFFILDLCHLMLRILYQIHISYNSRPGSPSQGLYISNYIIRTKSSRRTPVKLSCHWPARLWPLSSSHYPGYQMTKLTSIFTKRRGQLRPTGFSTSSPTVMLKGGKPHASTSGRSADRLDNLSCVYISEWEYTFQVTYVLSNVRCLST